MRLLSRLTERAGRQRHLPARLRQRAAERARDLRRAPTGEEKQSRDDPAATPPPRAALRSTLLQALAPSTGPIIVHRAVSYCPERTFYTLISGRRPRRRPHR